MSFNPNNKGHRALLAVRLVKMLDNAGFTLDASHKGEAVYERAVDGTTARIRVFTSVVNGEVRRRGKDAIRICAVISLGGETKGLVKTTRVNRTGTLDSIPKRVLAAMRKTYKVAQTRAKDQKFLDFIAKPTPARKTKVPARKKADSSFAIGTLLRFSVHSTERHPVTHRLMLAGLPREAQNHMAIVTSDGSEPTFHWVSGPLTGREGTLTGYLRKRWRVTVVA